MNRIEYLRELQQQTNYNLDCYSFDGMTENPKPEYEQEWNRELERLELINELIEEEEKSNFHIYTTMLNLRNHREKNCNTHLAYLEDREKSISCCLIKDDNRSKYLFALYIHNVNNFEDDRREVYTKEIPEEILDNRETLKKGMQYELELFEKFIESDRKNYRLYEKYYKNDKTEEFE